MDSLKRVKADGHIIFGSYSNVYEKMEWQIELAKLMKEEILKGVPVLGICFGHQLMAEAFGGKVGPVNMEMKLYSGSREIEILESIHGFTKGEKRRVFTSHRFEVKEIPKDFVHLATSSECQFDGLAHKKFPYFSFQGHPEASDYFVANAILKDSMTHSEEQKSYEDGLDIVSNFIKLVDSL